MNFYNVFRIKALKFFLHEFGVLAFAVLGKHLEILPALAPRPYISIETFEKVGSQNQKVRVKLS